MKVFKKVELQAKNVPTGSYAAGCPVKSGLCWRNCEIRS